MQELKMSEIEQVNGGIAPLVILGAKAFMGGLTAGCMIFGLYEATK
ncbi:MULTISPECIES: class IIb bacteriocin, lactobin A/cerein 7B family [Shewanella]|jgi:lactobin A/cerein 7B family class IIb bacteriocin|nr:MULTISPECIES: class IIb bacteriocin, lactobin A/cerein 7B family [Shewanella]MCA0949856.1 class IIb bacteriocin, lactobin A/cerein 7B family [Shewanella chilikensis]MCE9789632.1 class IIb bacteriocin, lactobin A/cerein 7B family [Shewanella chilikensis]NDO76559.1 class IIb bacteriocin, lactobin A/cerein 7B family [Shewanella sp. SE1]